MTWVHTQSERDEVLCIRDGGGASRCGALEHLGSDLHRRRSNGHNGAFIVEDSHGSAST